MKKVYAFSMAVACWIIPAGIACATDFPFSQYGQIQNVQSYSSNPFYNPDSPYNQRMPTAIYAQGTELNAGECRNVVDVIVGGLCAQRNNCEGLSLSDIRPSVVIQLSNLTGHNYVTACNGYIQPSFEDYMKNNSAVKVTGFPSAFPTVNSTQTENSSSELILSNPYELKKADWENNKTARQNELRALQRQNGSDDVALAAKEFPTTYADLSFTERMENDRAGYEPWKDAQAYKPIKIEDDETRYERENEVAQQQLELAKKQDELLQTTNYCAWCYKNQAKCYNDLAKQVNDLNKSRKDNACSEKVSGTDTSYIAQDVVSDAKCGWILKDNVRTVTLTDADCGTQNYSSPSNGNNTGNGSSDNPIVIDLG